MKVLVVSDVPSRAAAWTSWLRATGFETETCSGPYAGSCPRADGGVCEVRESADVALVDEFPPEDAELLGGRAERFCSASNGGPAVVFGREGRAYPASPLELAGVVREAVFA